MNKLWIMWITLAGFFLIPLSANAGPLIINFGSCAQVVEPCTPNTDEGTNTLNFVGGGLDLVATGSGASPNSNLFIKSDPPDESGLGLANDSSGAHEVSPGESLVLNFSNFAKAGALGASLELSSLQEGETAIVTDSTGSHVVTQEDSTGINNLGVSFSPSHTNVIITAGAGSVLAASSVSVIPLITPVPEVTPWLSVLTGLSGFFFLRRRWA